MASIVDNKKYGENHKVILKTKPVNESLFRKEGYRPGQSIFLITRRKVKPQKFLELTTGKKSIYLKDPQNKFVLLTGNESSINGSFNHFTNNAKSSTNILTEIKEYVSLFLFSGFIETGKTLSEEAIKVLVKKQKTIYDQYYDSFYYESAMKQLQELKRYNLKSACSS